MEESTTLVIPERPERQFLPDDLKIESWDKVESYFEDLKNRKLDSLESLEKWLRDWSEVEAVFDEDASWRYIRMTCDTTNETLVKAYDFYVSEIEPKVAPYYNDFSKKLIASPFLEKLDKEKYRIFLRSTRKNVEIFREENIPLNVEIAQESQKYGSISAKMTITHDGKELTLQQAVNFLKDPDRNVREKFFRMINARRGQDEKHLNDLLSRLITLRNKVAVNAGFKNFRDYKHTQMGRFD
jgi:oligoendopeptidase F